MWENFLVVLNGEIVNYVVIFLDVLVLCKVYLYVVFLIVDGNKIGKCFFLK